MIVHIPNVLSQEQVAHCREVMNRAAWVDGRVTSVTNRALLKTTASSRKTALRRGSSAT